MYVGHLLVVRRSLLDECGGLDPAFDTIQDFELLLRLSERTERIHHIPRVLYHWRAVPGSIAADAEAKPGVPELQARAVKEHLRRRGISAEAIPHDRIPHRIRLRPRARPQRPTVSVVIPSRGGGERALAAVRERTAYGRLETIVEEAEGPFRPAALANRGAERTGGEYLVFLGEDVEVTEPDWIERLLLYAEMPGVGAVGPTLVHPDGRVSAAGIRDRALRPGGAGDAGLRGRRRRLLRLALCRPGGLGDRDGLHAPAPLRFRGGSEGSRRPTAGSSRTTTSACGCEAAACRSSARPEPTDDRPHHRGAASLRLRRARPGALRRPLVGPARGRRPLLQPELLPRGRGLLAAAVRRGRARARPSGGRRMRVLFLHFGKLHVNSVIQAFHFGEEMTCRGHRGGSLRPRAGRPDRGCRASPASSVINYDGLDRLLARWRREPAETMICAWTPREVVRRATERAAAALDAPYVVHLEDNEEHLMAPGAAAPLRGDPPPATGAAGPSSLARSSSTRPAIRALIEGAAGVTMITEELDEFNFARRPRHLARPGIDPSASGPIWRPPSRRAELGLRDRRLRDRLPRRRALRQPAGALQPLPRGQAAAAPRPTRETGPPGQHEARRRRPAHLRRPDGRRIRARRRSLAGDPWLPGAGRRLRAAGRA